MPKPIERRPIEKPAKKSNQRLHDNIHLRNLIENIDFDNSSNLKNLSEKLGKIRQQAIQEKDYKTIERLNKLHSKIRYKLLKKEIEQHGVNDFIEKHINKPYFQSFLEEGFLTEPIFILNILASFGRQNYDIIKNSNIKFSKENSQEIINKLRQRKQIISFLKSNTFSKKIIDIADSLHETLIDTIISFFDLRNITTQLLQKRNVKFSEDFYYKHLKHKPIKELETFLDKNPNISLIKTITRLIRNRNLTNQDKIVYKLVNKVFNEIETYQPDFKLLLENFMQTHPKQTFDAILDFFKHVENQLLNESFNNKETQAKIKIILNILKKHNTEYNILIKYYKTLLKNLGIII